MEKGKPIQTSMKQGSRKEHEQKLSKWKQSSEVGDIQLEAIESTRKYIGIDILSRTDVGDSLSGLIILDADADAIDALGNSLPHMRVMEDIDIFFGNDELDSTFEDNDNQPEWHLTGVRLPEYRQNVSKNDGYGITVAVLDTGISPIDQLTNKLINPAFIYDFQYKRILERTRHHGDIESRHGTQVASLIASGEYGVAPDCQILDIAMAPQNEGKYSQFLNSMKFTNQSRYDFKTSILNLSQVVRGDFTSEHERSLNDTINTLLDNGIVPVIAAGNDGLNKVGAPGFIQAGLTVGAVDKYRYVWGLSGRQKFNNPVYYSKPDLVAPGVQVPSFNLEGLAILENGTSLATPIVSGIIALTLEFNSHLSARSLIKHLKSTCEQIDDTGYESGHGFLVLPESIGIT